MRLFSATVLIIAMFVGWWWYDLIPFFIFIANALILCFWALAPSRYEYLTTLGMIGTLIGLSLAFSTIDLNALSNPEAVKDMIGQTIHGIGIAISTTLTGICLWMIEDWQHE